MDFTTNFIHGKAAVQILGNLHFFLRNLYQQWIEWKKKIAKTKAGPFFVICP